MLNCAVLMGRLVAEPELRTTSTGLSVISFRIAVDRSFVKTGEERQADFIDVTAWDKKAEFVNRFFHKGSLIAVQGRIETGSYEDKNGIKRSKFEIVADKIDFCGPKSDNTGGGSRIDEAVANAPAPSYATGNAGDFETITDDDLPF